MSHPDPPDGSSKKSAILGASAATEEVRAAVDRAARVDSTVLITGESGVGKELVAREIHARSARRSGPFIPLNCAAIPESLIETELFGHEAGAYTDAKGRRRGAFELADGGTLFLDEVGDLSLSAQPKLLRALEAGEIVRVGGEQPLKVELRIIAATNQALKRMCREKRFRPELYYRLNVLSIRVPPLRERPEDIVVLADHFAHEIGSKIGRPEARVAKNAMEQLHSYPWPGNVRELRAAVEGALAFSSDSVLEMSAFELDPVSLPGTTGPGILDREWRDARNAFEAAYARHLLRKHDGNVTKAARAAGLATGSLYKMLRRLGLQPGTKVVLIQASCVQGGWGFGTSWDQDDHPAFPPLGLTATNVPSCGGADSGAADRANTIPRDTDRDLEVMVREPNVTNRRAIQFSPR